MNLLFNQVRSSSPEDRRDLFVTSARRIGTNERNLEKDFWVCWTLDALFNDLPAGGPRLLFKGGTSLMVLRGRGQDTLAPDGAVLADCPKYLSTVNRALRSIRPRVF